MSQKNIPNIFTNEWMSSDARIMNVSIDYSNEFLILDFVMYRKLL